MRSVKVERNPRTARGKTQKRPVRGGTRATELRSTFGKRDKTRPGPFARIGASVRNWFSFRRPMLLLGAGLIVLALVAALFAGGYVGRAVKSVNATLDAFIADAGFGISEVHLAGNVRTPPETVLAVLGFQPGQSIFAADVQAARWKLKKLDWVAEADVQRRYPDAIYVRLVEKLPYALWKAPDNQVYVVERNGGLITKNDIEKFASLPHLAGAGAPKPAADLIDAVAQHRAVAARTTIYRRVSERRWDLILDDGVVVQLPEAGWQKELDALESLIVDKSILERNLTEIDLRSPRYYFFLLKSGQASKVDRGSEL
jgi:cell division protein FtsQ